MEVVKALRGASKLVNNSNSNGNNHNNNNNITNSPLNEFNSSPKTVKYSLPDGWEAGIDKDGRICFINHQNNMTTYEDPRKDEDDESPPEPREITLERDDHLGFGFVAGSEKPVIIRFVKEGGPSEGLLQAGDQILAINGEDVKKAPREHVIELVKSCKDKVTLTVCQPQPNSDASRKSAILTAAKKAKLRSNPSRVRFAETVVIDDPPLINNGTHLNSCLPFLPNVLKVFLKNGKCERKLHSAVKMKNPSSNGPIPHPFESYASSVRAQSMAQEQSQSSPSISYKAAPLHASHQEEQQNLGMNGKIPNPPTPKPVPIPTISPNSHSPHSPGYSTVSQEEHSSKSETESVPITNGKSHSPKEIQGDFFSNSDAQSCADIIQDRNNIIYVSDELLDLASLPPPDTPEDIDVMGKFLEHQQAHNDPPTPYKETNGFQSQTDKVKGIRESPTIDASIQRHEMDEEDEHLTVSELHSICDQLNAMQSSLSPDSRGIGSPSLEEDPLRRLPQDIDEFIASVSVPLPPRSPSPAHYSQKNQSSLTSEMIADLCSLIIPPPPDVSSTLSEEQNEVIERFWRATLDMRRICSDEVEPAQNSHSTKSNHRVIESSSSTSSSSGYDSNVISLANGSTIDQSSSSSASTSNTLPPPRRKHMHIFEHSTDSYESQDDDSHDYSFPIDGRRLSLRESRKKIESNRESNFEQDSTPQGDALSIDKRSLSWSSLPEANPKGSRNSPMANGDLKQSHDLTSNPSCSRITGKPPIPPKPSIKNLRSPSMPENRRQIYNTAMKNGITPQQVMTVFRNVLHSPKAHGSSIENGHMSRVHFDQPEISHRLDENLGRPSKYRDMSSGEREDLFMQSQRDIDLLLARIEEAHEMRIRHLDHNNQINDEEKLSENYRTSRDALMNESRKFVTASKLFVKNATEGSHSSSLIEHLIECVALLERMYNMAEVVIHSMHSQAHITCLTDRLKECAATFIFTVDTIHKLAVSLESSPHDVPTNPYMGLLMTHATSLATSLSALMRTLRALCDE